MKKNSTISITDGIDVKFCEIDDPMFHHVEIYAMTDAKPSRNDVWFLNAEENSKSFESQLILCAFPNNKVGDGHNSTLVIDKNGMQSRSFLGKDDERIVGYVDPSANIRIEQYKNEPWVVIPAKISKYYCPELVEDFRKKGSKIVSTEILIDPDSFEQQGNVETYKKWRGLGITILGDDVSPAFEDAKAVNPKLKTSSLEERNKMIDDFEKELIEVSNCRMKKEKNGVDQETKNNELGSVRKEMKKNRQEFLDSFNVRFKEMGFIAHDFDEEGKAVICYKNNQAYSFTDFDKNDKVIDESSFKKLSLQAEVIAGEKTLVFNVDTLMSQLQGNDQIKKLTANNETLTAEIAAKNEKILALENEIKKIQEKEMEEKCVDEIDKHNEKYPEECQKITEEKKNEFIEKIKKNEFKNKDEMLTSLKALKADTLDEGQVKLNEKKKAANNQYTWGTAKLNSSTSEADDYVKSLIISEKK